MFTFYSFSQLNPVTSPSLRKIKWEWEDLEKYFFLSVMNIMYCLEEDLEQANSVCKHGFLCAGGFYKKKKLLNISDAVP